jgi:preprotein translocase subunit SecE
MIEKSKVFLDEVKVELAKATWPWDPKERGFKKYKELSDSTVVVVIAMLLLAGYIALWDFLMVNIMGYLTK